MVDKWCSLATLEKGGGEGGGKEWDVRVSGIRL